MSAQYGLTAAYRTFDEAWRNMRASVEALNGRVVWTQQPQVRRHGRWFGWDGFAQPICGEGVVAPCAFCASANPSSATPVTGGLTPESDAATDGNDQQGQS